MERVQPPGAATLPDPWTLLEQSHNAVFVTDGKGVIVYANRAFEEATGYSRQEAVGQTPRLLKSGWHAASYYEELWHTILSGRVFQGVFVNRKKSGELYWAEQIITPIRDAEGQITHFLSVWQDVTARQRAEAQQRRLLAVVEHTSDFVAIGHPDGRVEWYNRAARRMLGLRDDEDIRSIRIPDTHPEWAGRLVMEQGIPTAIREGIWRGETAFLSRDGREIPASQVIIAHKSPDGQLEYLSTIARDISEEKRLQAAVTRALAVERALRGIDTRLLQERPLQEVLEALCDGAVALGFRLCWVGLKEPDSTVRPVASRGLATDYVQAIRVRWDESPLGQGPGGRSIRTGKPAVVNDVETDPSFAPWREEALQRGYRSAATVPLATDGEVLGFLAVYSERPHAFDADTLRSLETLARQGTLAILAARQREELRRTQRLVTFHIDRMPLAHIIWDLDFRVIQWNPAATRIFGWTPEEVMGRAALEFLVPPEARAHVETVWAELRAGKEASHSINANFRRDGTRILCEWFNTPLRDASGEIVAVASMAQDISEVDRLRAQALENERQFHDLAEAAAEAILITDPQGAIVYANPAAERLFLAPRREMVSRPLQEFLPALPGLGGPWETEGRRSDGERLPLEGSASSIETRSGVRHTYVLRDLTERKRYEEQLTYLADHDPLTGLYNRRRFHQELERQLVYVRRYGEPGALVLLDLDGFKGINDTLGHRAGDEVLQEVARALRSMVRETDVPARLGGDEFAVLVPRTDLQTARALAQQVLDGLRQRTVMLNDEPVRLTASLGIAAFPADGDTVDTLLAQADVALYAPKDAGGNRVRLAREVAGERTPAASRIRWESRLRTALEKEGFLLYAQPIVDLKTLRVAQHELLVRLVDEQGRIVPPGEFLGIAERAGLIRSIDRWVLRQAIRLLAEQARRGHALSLAVNLSGPAFTDDELLAWMRQELATAGAPPSQLVLEITETAAIADLGRARRFVETLRAVGCRFALDDFGVGFGSFYYLKHLPVDYVKIDGSFIRSVGQDPVDAQIVKAIVEVAAGLGIQTIAECVEEASTIERLRQYGVDFAQGYAIGRPLSIQEADLAAISPLEPA